eukprot:TRINITY_DN3235_c0_g1_i1.p1 TRINITY_DN3235_c0_g1~~TRINITY_DN3235_c0_g1_i1.p1  ORF type:complete len:175 (-),score=29.64 TRINITY_DN3235_c0_g1_i1:24-548(-)
MSLAAFKKNLSIETDRIANEVINNNDTLPISNLPMKHHLKHDRDLCERVVLSDTETPLHERRERVHSIFDTIMKSHYETMNRVDDTGRLKTAIEKGCVVGDVTIFETRKRKRVDEGNPRVKRIKTIADKGNKLSPVYLFDERLSSLKDQDVISFRFDKLEDISMKKIRTAHNAS